MNEEIQVWQPEEFHGSDLLPISVGNKKMELIGREHIEVEDLIVPSLALLQGSSEVVKQGVMGARAGLFYLTGAEEFFEPPIRVLPVAYTKSRSLFPKEDRPEHAGLEECISRDAKFGTRYGSCAECPYSKWDDTKERGAPACSESHNFTVLTPFGPAIIRFQRTSAKAGQKLLSTWSMSGDPLWAHPLIISTKQRQDTVKGRQSTTHVMETKWAQRETVPPAAQLFAKAVYEQVNAAYKRGKFGSEDEGREA